MDTIGTIAAALADIGPEAARLLASMSAATKALLRHLGQDQDEDAASPATVAQRPQLPKPRRRGLGPGWQSLPGASAER